MFNFTLIFITVVAVAVMAAGTVILLRPAPKTESPVKAPADVITVVDVDTGAPDEVSEDFPAVPFSTTECALELSDMHEGDIIVGSGPSPEEEEGDTVEPHDAAGEADASEPEATRPEEPSDVVSKSISEEPEEASGTSPERPLELFEDLTY